MTTLFLFFVGLLVGFVTLVLSSRRRSPGNLALPIATTLVAVPMVGFCVFGFLASGEVSGREAIAFRLVYSLLFVLVVTGVFFAWKPRLES